jgi:predicted enzyme related to lactoylglutathione lyase
MADARISLVEFPADDADRARRFWAGVLGRELEPRGSGEGRGWQTQADPGPGNAASAAPGATGARIGVHARGKGPGDSFSLPYFEVSDLGAASARVEQLGGSIVHPGDPWTICKDSEGNPFALARAG